VNVSINFVILAFVVFLIVKQVNKLRRDKPIGAPPEDVLLLREIRDSLVRK
jgi:large conductance mechanosensitive channel